MEGVWSENSSRYKRCLICNKCNRSCRLSTSSTVKNPGRQFYSCAVDHATFFKWADEVQPHELIEVPYCGGCNAGVCRVERLVTGPNKGRILFKCRVKEGAGSCGYKVWQDELQMLEERPNLFQERIADFNKTSGTVTYMIKDSKTRDEGTDDVSPLIKSSDDLLCHEVTAQLVDHEVTSQMRDPEVILAPLFLNEPETISCLKCLEDQSNLTSRRPHKRSRYGDIIASGFPISDRFLAVCQALNSMSTRHCWVTDAMHKNLSTELNGWWGRLVFHPMPCLMPYALIPSISFVSNPLDSSYVAKDISAFSSSSIASTKNSWEVRSYRKLSFDPEQHHNPLDSTYMVHDKILVNSSDASYRRPLFTHGQCHSAEICLPVSLNEATRGYPLSKKGTHCIMSKSISNVFNQTAESLQNELLTLLETMDVKDHEAMSYEAESTFSALDRLLFDHENLKKRVKELIHCASSLVEIEESMPENDSHQKLAEHCCNERVRLDEMKRVHDKAVEAVSNNKKHLKVMQEEISSTMDWLFEVEAEVSCCEVEMKHLELELQKIAKDKEVLEVKYLIASKEVEESQKHLEQKETEHNAAKAAFERARALLRG